MTSLRNVFLAGACALAVGVGSMPVQAAPSNGGAANTIAGVPYDQIQKVDRRGGRGWGGGRSYRGGGGGGWRGAGFGGGGRYSRGDWGGRRGWGGGGRRYYSGGYGGRRYYGGYRRNRGYGGYAAAGVLGLATGALIAGNGYGYGYDRPYYGGGYGYDRPYGGYRRAYYGGGECKVISTRRDYYGRRYTTVRYRPC